METGAIDLSTVPGPVDLQATLESGQTFHWDRIDGQLYADSAPSGGSGWYRTVQEGAVVDLRQVDGALEWRSTTDPTEALRRRLRLDEDLDAILAEFPDRPVVHRAIERFEGLRLVREPFFGTLISFILSAQMRIERIHAMVTAVREAYGEPISFGEETVYSVPSPAALAAGSESALRELGVGYRAPYLAASAEMVQEDEFIVSSVQDQSYEAARDRLTDFVGVGPKVADCVLLFSLGFPDPVPLDTWIRGAIAEYFPEADRDSYAETSRAIRELFGPTPGYVQTYVFHHLRTRERVVAGSE